MAKNTEATLLIKIKSVGDEILKRFRLTLTDITNVAQAAINSIRRIGASFVQLAVDASKAGEVEEAFRSLVAAQGKDADIMLQNLKELSQGTVSNLDLMREANEALIRGLPIDQFGKMVEIAKATADATGQSMEALLNSLVKGLSRGSNLMLTSLGIVVDTTKAQKEYAASIGKTAEQLTEADKRQAFVNEALRQGKNNIEKMGGGTISLSDSMDILTANIKNLSIELGEQLIPFVTTFISKANTIVDISTRLFKAPNAQELRGELTILNSEVTALTEKYKNAAGFELFWSLQTTKTIEQKKVRIAQIEEELAALDMQSEAEKKAGQDKLRRDQDQLTADEEKNLAEAELDIIKKEQEAERDAAWKQLMADQDMKAKFDELDRQILHEENLDKQRVLANNRRLLREKEIDTALKKEKTALQNFEVFLTSEKVKIFSQGLDQISSLSTAHNKTLAAIGKAAAITQATISLALGIVNTLKLGWPLGYIMAPLVATAGAVQIAKIAGVQLADGGIVQARPGGIQATIGEGGQDEAVIPLPDGGIGAMGTTVNLTINGGILGDQSSARELALALDKELLKLRRGRESVAFDSDFV